MKKAIFSKKYVQIRSTLHLKVDIVSLIECKSLLIKKEYKNGEKHEN